MKKLTRLFFAFVFTLGFGAGFSYADTAIIGSGTSVIGSPCQGCTFTGQSLFDDGTVLLPSITNAGDPDTGAWFPAADTFAISTGGVERIRWDSSGIITGTANAIPDTMLSTNVALLTGAQTISGIKTFSANPVFNALGIPDASIAGMGAAKLLTGTVPTVVKIPLLRIRTAADAAVFNGSDDMIAGNVLDARLSANIPFLDAADLTFTGNMNIGTEGGGTKVLSLRGSDATSGSEGGELALYLADDFDTSFNKWIIDVFEDDMRFIAGSSEVMRIASNGFIGFGEGQPATLVQLTGASTPTLYIESTTASNGGRFILEDTDGAGCSQATVLNGTITWATVTCP